MFNVNTPWWGWRGWRGETPGLFECEGGGATFVSTPALMREKQCRCFVILLLFYSYFPTKACFYYTIVYLNNILLDVWLGNPSTIPQINHSTCTARRGDGLVYDFIISECTMDMKKIIMHIKVENLTRVSHILLNREKLLIIKNRFWVFGKNIRFGIPWTHKSVFTNLCRSSVYHWWTYFDQIYTYFVFWV